MSKTTTRNLIISSILFLVSMSVFGLMVFQVIGQGERLTAQVDVIKKERAREYTYNNILKISEETESDRKQVEKFFLYSEGDSVSFLNQIDSLAPATGVFIDGDQTSLEILEDKDVDGSWLVVGISFFGSKDDSRKFVKVLEAMSQVLRITSVDMKAMSSTEWSTNLTMQVRILSYDE